MAEKSLQDVHRFVTSVAKHQGWVVNPDPEFLQDIEEGLRRNWNRYGYFMCPCRDSSGNKESDSDLICPCDYNLPDQAEYGHCFCGLFLSREFASRQIDPEPIPERRPEHLNS
ncbi:MAG: ferredoxin:thioredoxin reductase [Spirochaetaceae bacterium]|nr:MAG: ferredoxin:thioredoxin reductase [Spirochaetaceae bacterium]